MTRDEIENKINQDLNVLEQHDYIARPVAFEVARLFKAQHPEIQTPVLDKYFEIEAEADALRAEIRELREQLEEMGNEEQPTETEEIQELTGAEEQAMKSEEIEEQLTGAEPEE